MPSLILGIETMLMRNPHEEIVVTKTSLVAPDTESQTVHLFGQAVLLLLFLVAILLRSLTF
ncbi:hypothetical protein RBSH_00804 [Rhodopirellula baltica SH28]|uniref:Uncharacterized protein n=1 Tax=Rhodopirellula baltica SH28 TaxID=993517 RepID=K5DNJ2_RHOBT|nr:hypothetical protein [Rhodopirellula baltica]EKK04063.1 hypothetical protein RBSH_00804 [Rhodopirellula baltica SH28]